MYFISASANIYLSGLQCAEHFNIDLVFYQFHFLDVTLNLNYVF